MAAAVEDWETRIGHEFVECPGLRLTSAQAARLWGISLGHAEQILASLVARDVLARTATGVFTRRQGCAVCG